MTYYWNIQPHWFSFGLDMSTKGKPGAWGVSNWIKSEMGGFFWGKPTTENVQRAQAIIVARYRQRVSVAEAYDAMCAKTTG